MALYWSLLFSSIIDIRRNDFWIHILHHSLTLCLLSMSWIINSIRVGTLILVSHDVSDILLELSKLLRYGPRTAKYAPIVFILFSFWLANFFSDFIFKNYVNYVILCKIHKIL